jgi:diguanylate cyclase (GGDEF)-like protein
MSDKALLAAVLDELCSAVAADAGSAFYVDDGDGVLRLAATSGGGGGKPNVIARLRGHAGSAGGGATGATADDGKTLILDVPGQNGGFVVVGRRGGPDFTQQDLTLARLYVNRLASNAASVTAHMRGGWTRQLETIQRIAARLTRLASLEEVGATICNETRQVIDYAEAQVLIATPDGALRTVAAMASGNAQAAAHPLPNTGPAGEAIARAAVRGIPVIASDLPDLGPMRPGPCSLLAVPLHYENRVLGVICLLAHGGRAFDDDDLRLLQILGDQAAVAVENARLLSGRDQLVHELAALLEVSEAAGKASDETELAKVIAEKLRRATKTDAAIVSRFDEDSTVLRVLWRDGVNGPATGPDIADSPIRRGVLRDARPIVVHSDSADTATEVLEMRLAGARTLVCLPLNAGGRTIGIVELLAFGAPRHLDEAEMQAAEAMASLAATGLEKIRLLHQLRSAADMDLVTGVSNHRYLQERLRQEVARSARSHSPFAVLMLDLDKFKPINDKYGHADGDRVLHGIGATIKANVRTADIVARYGGDEFVVLMPDTHVEQAEHVARRVVSGILGRRHKMSDGSDASVGVSAGLAVYPADGRTSTQLLQAADAAMYSAKRSGGRQVERSAPGQMPMEALPAPAVL